MNDILQQAIINKNTIYKELNSFFSEHDCSELLDILNNVKKEYLYPSYFHGLHHSQKVCLFAYLISKSLNLNETDMKIIMDAALYHDIGRSDDNEEPFHGFNSANKIQEKRFLKSDIYEDEINLGYLRAICDAHSTDDKKMKIIFDSYKYEYPDFDQERFEFLSSILKDADALDRTRFKRTTDAALKVNYLRLEYSKSLVDLAKLINGHYCFKVSEKEYNEEKYLYEGEPVKDCFHGVGFDFFKFESILKHGILSKYEAIKENISTTRNFNGNNKDLWISVVDADSIHKNGKAYNEFIKAGISFYCFVPKLKDGENVSRKSDYNIAIKSWEYCDEKFAFNKIDYKDIHSIVIVKDVWNKDVSTLNYLYGSNNLDIITNKIKSYKSNIESRSDIILDMTCVNSLLEEYKNQVLEFESKPVENQKQEYILLGNRIDIIIDKLNKEVQKWMTLYFESVLGKNNVKVCDVIKYILNKEKINISDCYNNEEMVLILNPIKEQVLTRSMS